MIRIGFNRLRFLVIDDNAHVRRILRTEEVGACACGLRLDSICAVVRRYSKLAPVARAARLVAPAMCKAAFAAVVTTDILALSA